MRDELVFWVGQMIEPRLDKSKSHHTAPQSCYSVARDPSRGVIRGLYRVRGYSVVILHRSTKNLVENDRVGSWPAIPVRSDHFPPAGVAPVLPGVERCGAGPAQRFQSWFSFPVWTTRRESGRNRLSRFHTRLPGSSRRHLLRCVHVNALSPAGVASVRTTLRETLSPHDED